MHISDISLTGLLNIPLMKRTTGKETKELLIKATSPETRSKPFEAVLGGLITKWAFSEETHVDTQQTQVALAHVVSFTCAGVNDAKGIRQLPLCFISASR